MIKEIKVSIYRKLKDITLGFSPYVNIVSGVNGTCKSSLLHIISNAFQSVKQNTPKVSDPSSVKAIKKLNALVNAKIEALTRGDKTYSDPANGVRGTLYTIKYENGLSLDFRRHNSAISNRYAVKPKYARGTRDELPTLPVVYLGLPRLFPYGEVGDSQKIDEVRVKIPQTYIDEARSLYKELMFIDIDDLGCQDVNGFKKRGNFTTTKKGVDSNTISSGEDNVFIILTALVSLHYYYDVLKEKGERTESVLLIDEFDATLHPSLQCRLMSKIREYSKKYKIQVVATTHSLTMIEECLRKKDNVIYLVDNRGEIGLMKDPDRYKIEAKLKTLSATELYADRKIPLILEDAEARLYLDEIFDYYQEKYDRNFSDVRNCFEVVDENFGAEVLKKLFNNPVVIDSLRGICVLDGDKGFSSEAEMFAHSSVVLPGGNSPEKVLFEYADKLYERPDDEFWTDAAVESESIDIAYYEVNIRPEYHKIKAAIEGGESKKPVRESCKSLFNNYLKFYKMVLRRMLRDPAMCGKVLQFMRQLNVVFKKNADFHRISSSRWMLKKIEVSNGG